MVSSDCFEGVGARAAKRARWLGHVRGCAGEGLSAAAYCRREGLGAASFYRWRRVFLASGEFVGGAGEAGAAPGSDGARVAGTAAGASAALFAEVALGGALAEAPAGIEVVVSGGRRVRVQAGFDAASLARVVAVLEGAPC